MKPPAPAPPRPWPVASAAFHPRARQRRAIGLTPLIGVMFILPVFFLLAGRLAGNEVQRAWLKAGGPAEASRVTAVMEVLREAEVERLKQLTAPEGS